MKKVGILIALLASFAAGALFANRAEAQKQNPKDPNNHFLQYKYEIRPFESQSFFLPRTDTPIRMEILTSSVLIITEPDEEGVLQLLPPTLRTFNLAQEASSGFVIGKGTFELQGIGCFQPSVNPGIKLTVNDNGLCTLSVVPSLCFRASSVGFTVNLWY